MPAEKVISELIKEYGDSILRMCYIYLKDYHLAEDVVQETFLQVYNNYDSFRQQSSVKTWITRIAVNLCKNQMRTRWFSVKKEEEFPILSYTEDYDGVIDREQLLTAIGNLRPKYREAVLLFYYQELSIKEIAGLLNKKESTVKVRLKRAREQLKQELKEDYFYE
ncbi:MAG: sigma-70 family RNA polymerase sigma factor [Lachnospiraceae bacterium]|uniref:RNA polymerase sigma factor n=1 Tax=Candidatus Merdisoma sp. JLR.KK006 TaxID=3112626 RepID=UPI002FF28CC0|nr:sigma-70 family RNA polymerase sigma factor [Lachnospiraceae bacterium]